MRIINVISKTDAYILIRDLNLKPRAAGTIDVDTLILSELKSLRNLYLANDITLNINDFNYIVAKIESLSSSGSDSPVRSVNEEIGDVVLDASKIKVEDGDTIQEEFEQLSQVAYTGNYLDLINRPNGSPEPFQVITWNPYLEDLEQLPFVSGNNSTSFVNGVLSTLPKNIINTMPFDVGMPVSENIIFNNGSGSTQTNVTVNVVEGSYGKSFAIDDVKSLSFKPLNSFSYNNDGTKRGADVLMFLVQVEESDNLNEMTVIDVMSKPRNIGINITGLYQTGYNSYTNIAWSITNEGQTVYNQSLQANGNYNFLSTDVVNGNLIIGAGYNEVNLLNYGFDINKRFVVIGMVQVNSNDFDVQSPFSFSIEETDIKPKISNTFPDIAEIKINKNEELSFNFNSPNSSEYISISFGLNLDQLKYYTSSGSFNISSDYIDNEDNLLFKIEGDLFQLKNFNTNLFDTIYTKSETFINNSIEPLYDSLKTSWEFDLISWASIEILNGVLPINCVDGSTLKVIADGLFDNKQLRIDDIVTPYDNKTKILLHRVGKDVSNNVETAGENPVSGNAVLSYAATAESLASSTIEVIDDTKLGIKISEITPNRLIVSADGLYVDAPASNNGTMTGITEISSVSEKFHDVSGTTVVVNLATEGDIYRISLPVESSTNIVLVNLSSINGASFNRNGVRVLTFIFPNVPQSTAVYWPNEFKFPDDLLPELISGTTLVVNALVAGNPSFDMGSTGTNSKFLCTYSTYSNI